MMQVNFGLTTMNHYFKTCQMLFASIKLNGFNCNPKLIRLSLVSLFYGISTFVGYSMPKPSFEKSSSGAI